MKINLIAITLIISCGAQTMLGLNETTLDYVKKNKSLDFQQISMRTHNSKRFKDLVDLTGAKLSDANLSGADLTNANLRRANLRRANLTNANLTNANLIFAKLDGANLSGADLSSANLSGADLTNANLTNANLTNANLTGAKFNGAKFNGANLTRAYQYQAKEGVKKIEKIAVSLTWLKGRKATVDSNTKTSK